MSVNFADPIVWLILMLVPAITVVLHHLGSILVTWLKEKTPFGFLVTEQMMREAVQQAINFGIGYAIQKVKESSAGDVKFDNAFIAQVVQYVTERTPDALEFFGITATSLEAMVKARLGLLQPEAAGLVK